MRIILEKIRLSSVDGPDPCWGKPGGRFSGGYLDIGWGASALLMVFDPHRLARTYFNKNGRNWRESRDVQDVLRPTLRTGPFVSAAPWWLKQVTGPNQSQEVGNRVYRFKGGAVKSFSKRWGYREG